MGVEEGIWGQEGMERGGCNLGRGKGYLGRRRGANPAHLPSLQCSPAHPPCCAAPLTLPAAQPHPLSLLRSPTHSPCCAAPLTLPAVHPPSCAAPPTLPAGNPPPCSWLTHASLSLPTPTFRHTHRGSDPVRPVIKTCKEEFFYQCGGWGKGNPWNE